MNKELHDGGPYLTPFVCGNVPLYLSWLIQLRKGLFGLIPNFGHNSSEYDGRYIMYQVYKLFFHIKQNILTEMPPVTGKLLSKFSEKSIASDIITSNRSSPIWWNMKRTLFNLIKVYCATTICATNLVKNSKKFSKR